MSKIKQKRKMCDSSVIYVIRKSYLCKKKRETPLWNRDEPTKLKKSMNNKKYNQLSKVTDKFNLNSDKQNVAKFNRCERIVILHHNNERERKGTEREWKKDMRVGKEIYK